ncbi:MAG: hypothetical protein RJA33_408 [Actinomycetota bacterium]|jgi:hypothetical protein
MNETNFDDEEHDSLYYSLINDLLEKNIERYASQSEMLMSQKEIVVEVDGRAISYQLTRNGCTFRLTKNLEGSKTISWSRLGWRKSAKREALPWIFAKSEATALMDFPL